MLFLFSSNPFNPFPETQFFHHIFVQRDRELGKRERKNYFKPENIKKIQNYKHWSSYHQELISLLTYRYMLTIFIFEIYICVSICYTCILYKTIWIFTFYKIIDRYVFCFFKTRITYYIYVDTKKIRGQQAIQVSQILVFPYSLPFVWLHCQCRWTF